MMMDDDLPRVGEILRSKYHLVRTLGEGGMSVVFEGRRLDGERVAVKVLAPEYLHDEALVARFQREARAIGQLRSPHVVKVLDVDTTETGLPFMVMDFLAGRDLAVELERRRRIPIDEAADYLIQTCAAMDDAHRVGVVHRDLKPANLFLTNLEGAPVVKVLDFGISKLVNESSRLTGAGSIMGTVIYMSPEQIHSPTDVDQRADIWSLGVILFELLAGRVPFDGPAHAVAVAIVRDDAPDIRTFAPDVPDTIARAIGSMLQRERDQRLKNTRQVISVLAPFVRADSVGAEIAASFGPKTTTPNRKGVGNVTVPMSAPHRQTVPLGSNARSPQPPATRGPIPTPPGSSNAIHVLPALTEPAVTVGRTAREARRRERRRTARRGLLAAILLGAIVGGVAAGIVIAIFLLTTPNRPPPRPRPESSEAAR